MAGKSLLPLLFVAGGAVVLMGKKKKKAKKKPGIPEDYMTGYFSPGATVSAAEGLANIESVIALRNFVMRDRDGDMHNVESATFHPPSAQNPEGVWASDPVFQDPTIFSGMGPVIGRVVTNFYGPGAVAFEGEVMDEFIEGPTSADPRDPEAAPAVALAVLKRLRPKINWDTVEVASVPGMVLGGATMISRLVQQQLPGA